MSVSRLQTPVLSSSVSAVWSAPGHVAWGLAELCSQEGPMKAKCAIAGCFAVLIAIVGARVVAQSRIGQEVSVAEHLAEGEEFRISVRDLVERGSRLFAANWTSQEAEGVR